MVKWPQKCRVDWDTTDGRNGGAQCTVWVVLMEMERFNGKAKAKAEDQGAVALVHSSQPSYGLGLGDAFHIPKEDLAGAVRLL